jgi:hypothetical protein
MQNFLLYRSYLMGVEDCFQIKPAIDIVQVRDYCHRYKEWFMPYHKNSKYDQRRKALAITNATGEDDDSSFIPLKNTTLTEMDFTAQTIHYRASGLAPLLDKFGSDLGRTHLINTLQGGYFKPHRDGARMCDPSQECFRLLLCIDHCDQHEMHFVLENSKVLPLSTNRLYYINTTKTHSQISFHDDCFFMIANIRISENSIRTLHELSYAL